MLEGIRHGLPIFAVEGEKAVDRIDALCLVATCNPEGAAKDGQRPKWRESYAQALSEADLVVCGDLDSAGQAHAAVIAETTYRRAAQVRVLELADLARSCGFELPEKSGLDDWIEARRQEGASHDDIVGQLSKWIEGLDDYRPPAAFERSPKETDVRDLSISFSELIATEYPPREWILTDLVQVRDTAMVHAWRGVGKSFFALGAALAVATFGLPPFLLLASGAEESALMLSAQLLAGAAPRAHRKMNRGSGRGMRIPR